MHTRNTLLSFFMVPLIACGGGDPDSSSPAPGGDERPDPGEPLVAAGDYQVKSQFQLSTRDLGDDIAVIGLLEDIENDPYGTLGDFIADEIGLSFVSPVVKTVLQLNVDPSFEQDFKQAAATLLDVSGDFEIVSTLSVEESSGNLTVSHKGETVAVTISGDAYEWDVDAKSDSTAVSAGAERSGDDVTLDAHVLTVPYSGMLRAALDQIVVPTIDPNASNLAEALSGLVDCQQLGADLEYDFGGNATVYATACIVGIEVLADEIETRIVNIADLSTDMELAGTFSMSDVSGDGKADQITGNWSSKFLFGDSFSFAEAAEFSGQRLR